MIRKSEAKIAILSSESIKMMIWEQDEYNDGQEEYDNDDDGNIDDNEGDLYEDNDNDNDQEYNTCDDGDDNHY